MSVGNGGQEGSKQVAPDSFDSWYAYWTAHGMPWRTEPEIDEDRQRLLAGWRAVHPDIVKGVYPFRNATGAIKLSRADVEWLLATHESGGMRGPVDGEDDEQHGREGVDLSGADLHRVDLRKLPMARLRGAAKTNLSEAHLEGTSLVDAHLEYADLRRAYFDADTHLGGVWLGTQRGDVYARVGEKTGLRLALAVTFGLLMDAVPLLFGLGAAVFTLVSLTSLLQVLTAPTRLVTVAPVLLVLLCALGAALVRPERGTPRDWRHAAGARLTDLHWGGTNLTVVDWQRMRVSGDELHARRRRDSEGHAKRRQQRLADYEAAVRTYRQLAVELRTRGLNEDADAFAFRAQLMQRRVLWRQYKPGRWLGSLLLDLISGYGYRPGRTLLWYMAVIEVFAFGFALVTRGVPLFGLVTPACGFLSVPNCVHPLQWYEAIVLSVSSFHGRGFFQPLQNPGDPVAILAAIEAVLGLFIEITFIATFTQRFFAR